jgi:hypothetical protein
MFENSEKVGKVQRLDGQSSQEAIAGQKNGGIDKGVAGLEQNKSENVGWNVTQKIE